MFKDKMVTPATPERVYTLCKIVEKEARAVSDVREKMEPAALSGDSQVYFPDYRAAAEELGLIVNSDQMLSLAVDSKHIASIDAMRQYINTKLQQFPNGQFYKVTQAYFNLGAAVLSGDQSLANLGPQMTELTGMQVDAMAMRAWRFWVSFLGFGYLQDMFFIPNANIFMSDILRFLNPSKGTMYSFSKFIELISPYAQMIIGTDASNHQINYGLSNALRTLHDSGTIKLEHILDSSDIWNLHPLKAHPISGTVTNVTIL